MRDSVPRTVLPPCVTDVDVGLHDVARSLMEIRRWLLDRGCHSPVLRCARNGSRATIRVEFDYREADLRDRFRRAFA